MVEKKDELKIETELSPNFSLIHIDGTYGGISTDKSTAWIQFFQDLPHSEFSSEKKDMTVAKVRRIMLMDLRMSTSTFRAIAKWMDETVKTMDSPKK